MIQLLVCFLLFLLCSINVPSVCRSEMKYIEFGESNQNKIELSQLILGTGQILPENAELVFAEAVAMGINVFDTAPIYANDMEQRLGRWLSGQNRSDLYVITKVGFPFDLAPGKYQSRLNGNVGQIVNNVQEELKNVVQHLGSIQPALVFLHRDDGDWADWNRILRGQTPVRTILEALSNATLKLKYRFFGLSNWENSRAQEAHEASNSNQQLAKPLALSNYFSIMEMGNVKIYPGGVQVVHTEMMNSEFQKGLKMMTYSPLGGFSIFSKSWEEAKNNALALKKKGDRYWNQVFDSIFYEANEARFNRVHAFAAAFAGPNNKKYTADQVASAYALAHERADFMVIGPRTVEQLKRTVESLELAKMMTKNDLDFLYDGSKKPQYEANQNFNLEFAVDLGRSIVCEGLFAK